MTKQPNVYTHISTATTTQVATGACTLIGLNINTTSTGTITIYDATSGTSPVVAGYKASIAEQPFTFGEDGVTMANGIRVATTGAYDLTVVWRTH